MADTSLGGSSRSDPRRDPVLVVLAAGRARRFGGCKPLAPVGPGGGAIVDFLADDAWKAGFASVVLVLNPDTGPLLREHVRRAWPASLPVAFAEQASPRGTVDAVLAARHHVEPSAPFAVANADDLYGIRAMRLLAEHLTAPPPTPGPPGADVGETHVTVAFRLERTLLGRGRVNRGICEVGADGFLRGLDERREVGFEAGGALTSLDGRSPRQLDPGSPAAVNLWGFWPGIWDLFEDAFAPHAAVAVRGPHAGSGPAGEVLIPEVLGRAVRDDAPGRSRARVRVALSEGACMGVTHAEDLAIVRERLAGQIAAGERSGLWLEALGLEAGRRGGA